MSYTLVVTRSTDIAAPAQRVWDLLMDWAAIVDWMPAGYIRSLQMEDSAKGPIRHLVTGKGVALSERLDRSDAEAGVLQLSMIGQLPWNLLSYQATGTVKPGAPGNSSLTWSGKAELANAGDAADDLGKLLSVSYNKMFLGIRQAVEPGSNKKPTGSPFQSIEDYNQ
jgi:hypothetical protein